MLDGVVNRRPGLASLHDWIAGKGGIVYSPMHKIEKELVRSGKTKDWFTLMRKKGNARIIPAAEVKAEMQKLPQLNSDDPHIIALAKAARAKLLATRDRRLIDDFKRVVRRGKVYKSDRETPRLLQRAVCRTQ